MKKLDSIIKFTPEELQQIVKCARINVTGAPLNGANSRSFIAFYMYYLPCLEGGYYLEMHRDIFDKLMISNHPKEDIERMFEGTQTSRQHSKRGFVPQWQTDFSKETGIGILDNLIMLDGETEDTKDLPIGALGAAGSWKQYPIASAGTNLSRSFDQLSKEVKTILDSGMTQENIFIPTDGIPMTNLVRDNEGNINLFSMCGPLSRDDRAIANREHTTNTLVSLGQFMNYTARQRIVDTKDQLISMDKIMENVEEGKRRGI